TTDFWLAWIPLPVVAVYQCKLPVQETWLSGPVISGDKVYIMGSSGFMHELPLDPKTVDPAFPRPANGLLGFDLGNTNLYGPAGLRKIRNVSWDPAIGGGRYNPSPAISDGLLAASSIRGLTLYGSPNVLIADANRIVEASGDSTALANTEAVTKQVLVDDNLASADFPVPTDPGFAINPVTNQPYRLHTERKLLSRPAVVRKLDRKSSLTSIFLSTAPTIPEPPAGSAGAPGVKETSEIAEESYLAADTGNSRCVEFNPVGKVVWEAGGFQDPFGILSPGETLSLSGPMDVQRWIEIEAHPTLGPLYVVHTLIADTGNTRVVELVDKVTPQRGVFNSRSFVITPDQVGVDNQPVRWYHVLVWSSQTNAQGLKLKYRTAQRIFWSDSTGGLIPVIQPPSSAQ
ncbi:MAG TPA: hypothetical protein VFU47_12125, partial [Armatimonadota bacterium]|nr:hypothetical protein [Armatimonadota bacterium]